MPSTSTGFTPNLTYSSANESAKVAVSAGGWSDARVDLLEALGELGQLVEALAGLFGPGVAAPLRSALLEARSHELYLVDGVIDNEARLRDQLGSVTEQLNATRDRERAAHRDAARNALFLTDAVLEEVARAHRQNRRLSTWAAEAIDKSSGSPAHDLIPAKHWEWLLGCQAAISVEEQG